jgi:hypothetical protein
MAVRSARVTAMDGGTGLDAVPRRSIVAGRRRILTRRTRIPTTRPGVIPIGVKRPSNLND